jgi:hypothetical protein
MKIFFHQDYDRLPEVEEDLCVPSVKEDLKKTRSALEIAYAGFDNAVDTDMIDSYIYQINALQKRYTYLLSLASTQSEAVQEDSYAKTPVRSRIGHVFS